MNEPILVFSQQPPGGRCTLYARYAEALSSAMGLANRIIYTDIRGAHGAGFPTLSVKGAALQPADGVILTPADICAGLADLGLDAGAELLDRLQSVLEHFLEEADQETGAM